MARKFKDFVERPKPRKRPGRHKKDLTKMKKEIINHTANKEENNNELQLWRKRT